MAQHQLQLIKEGRQIKTKGSTPGLTVQSADLELLNPLKEAPAPQSNK